MRIMNSKNDNLINVHPETEQDAFTRQQAGQGALSGPDTKQYSIALPKLVQEIITSLEDRGFEAYAVGGCVRDSLLGRIPGDWDITTSAKPEEIKSIFRRTVDTGIEHGTVTVLLGDESFEVTTYRVDGEYRDMRHPAAVSFTSSLAEDLRRRDFTINAMAYNMRTGLVDLYDGIGDLERRLVRAVGDPDERFNEDALRILRAVRFAAQLDFTVEEHTENAICRHAANLAAVSKERILTEISKLVCSAHIEKVEDLFRLGLAEYIAPGFTEIDLRQLRELKAAAELAAEAEKLESRGALEEAAALGNPGITGTGMPGATGTTGTAELPGASGTTDTAGASGASNAPDTLRIPGLSEDFQTHVCLAEPETFETHVCLAGPNTSETPPNPDKSAAPAEPDTSESPVEPDTSESPTNLSTSETPAEPGTSETPVEASMSETPAEGNRAEDALDLSRAVSVDKRYLRVALLCQGMSEKKTQEMLRGLKADNVTVRQGSMLAEMSLQPLPDDRYELKKIISKMPLALFEDLLMVKKASTKTHLYREHCPEENIEKLIGVFREIVDWGEPIYVQDLVLSGRDLVESGIPEGPEVGQILSRMLDAVHKDPRINTVMYLISHYYKEPGSRK